MSTRTGGRAERSGVEGLEASLGVEHMGQRRDEHGPDEMAEQDDDLVWLVAGAVRLGDRPVVLMPMVFVVHVAMLVLHRRVEVLVLVSLGQVQPEANTHQQSCADQRHCHRIMQKGDRDDGADERREREVSPGPCSSEMPQRRYEQD